MFHLLLIKSVFYLAGIDEFLSRPLCQINPVEFAVVIGKTANVERIAVAAGGLNQFGVSTGLAAVFPLRDNTFQFECARVLLQLKVLSLMTSADIVTVSCCDARCYI